MKPWKPALTQLEFMFQYAERSGVALDTIMQHRVCLPCGCEEPICDGYAMIAHDLVSEHRLPEESDA